MLDTTMRKVGKCSPSAKFTGSSRGLTPKNRGEEQGAPPSHSSAPRSPPPCMEERSRELRRRIRQTKSATFEYYTRGVAQLLTVLLLETYTWSVAVYIILT